MMNSAGEVEDYDAIGANIAFYTGLRAQYLHTMHALSQLASQLDWREPIRLQERLEGKVFPIAVAPQCLETAQEGTEHDQNKKDSWCEQFLCVVSLLISLDS